MWEAPSDFDLVKELNAHAGRLATLLGFFLAAASISLSTGPFQYAVTAVPAASPLRSTGIYAALVFVSGGFVASVIALGSAGQPAIPDRPNEQVRWKDLIARKSALGEAADFTIFGCYMGLIAAWILAVNPFTVSFALIGVVGGIIDLVGLACLLAAAGAVVYGGWRTLKAHIESSERSRQHRSTSTAVATGAGPMPETVASKLEATGE